jgi:hypothetical protein
MEQITSGIISPQRQKFWIICGWAIIILLYVAVRTNLVDIPLDRDEGTFGYMGQLVLNHQMPYKDGLDHKPPLIFYLYSAALLLAPPTSRGIHLFLHIYNFITLVALYVLAKTCFRSTAAGMWSAFVYAIFSSSPVIQGFTASTEMFMLLPIILSLLFSVLAGRGKSALYAFLSGLCGALACWTKQVAAFSVAFASIWLAVTCIRNRDSRGALGLLIWWLSGAAGTSILIIGYFYFKGLFNEFTYWSFTHNLYYGARLTLAEKTSMFFDWLGIFMREDFILVTVGLLYSIFVAVRKDVRGYFVLGFFVASLLGTIPGFAYRHYFAQLAPAVSLLAGFAFSEIVRLIPARGKAAAMLVCGALIIGIPIVVNRSFYLENNPNKISRDFFGLNPFPESADVAAFISENSAPDDRIFIFGSEPQILFYAQRRSATPFVHVYPLMFVHPGYREMQESLLKDVMTNDPKFILFVLVPTSTLWDGKADLSFVENLKAFVAKNYLLAGRVAAGERPIMLLFQKAGQKP